MSDIQRADPISRRRGVFLLVIGSLVGGLTLVAFQRYRPLLERWLLADPSQLAQRLTTVVVFLVVEDVTRRLQNRKLPDTLASHAFDEHELGIQPSPESSLYGRSVACRSGHSARSLESNFNFLQPKESTEMGLFDKWGKDNPPDRPQSADEQAIVRYRYMLKTAPPETIEQAHAEAFARLTPEQQRTVLQRMAETIPDSDRASLEQIGPNPQALARMATRAEIRQPGAMERMFGQAGGAGFGGMMAGSLLGSIAGTVIGSMIAREFFAHDSPSPDTLASTSESSRDDGLTDADHAVDDGDDFDDSFEV